MMLKSALLIIVTLIRGYGSTLTSDIDYITPMKITIYLEDSVGSAPPQNISDFRCISNNWRALNCTFNFNENAADTNYKVLYGPTWSDGKGSEMILQPRKDETNPVYWFPVQDYIAVTRKYEFTVIQRNQKGHTNQSFIVDNWESIRPDPVQNLNVTEVNGESVSVSWNIHTSLLPYSDIIKANIEAELKYKEIPDGPFVVQTTSYNSTQRVHSVVLANLRSQSRYFMEVRIRGGMSDPKREELWSDSVQYTFQV